MMCLLGSQCFDWKSYNWKHKELLVENIYHDYNPLRVWKIWISETIGNIDWLDYSGFCKKLCVAMVEMKMENDIVVMEKTI